MGDRKQYGGVPGAGRIDDMDEPTMEKVETPGPGVLIEYGITINSFRREIRAGWSLGERIYGRVMVSSAGEELVNSGNVIQIKRSRGKAYRFELPAPRAFVRPCEMWRYPGETKWRQ